MGNAGRTNYIGWTLHFRVGSPRWRMEKPTHAMGSNPAAASAIPAVRFVELVLRIRKKCGSVFGSPRFTGEKQLKCMVVTESSHEGP